MADLNKVLLMGRLGVAPELKTTASGKQVTRLRVATSHVRKGENEDVHETDWHDVVTFGRLAENCGRYLTKGRKVFIEGRMSCDVWTDRDGKRRLSREVIAQRVDFLEKSPSQGAGMQQADAAPSYDAAGADAPAF